MISKYEFEDLYKDFKQFLLGILLGFDLGVAI